VTRLAFIDTETTELDRRVRKVWEVGAILREDDGTEHEWGAIVGDVDLFAANHESLVVGRFYERHPGHGGESNLPVLPEQAVAKRLDLLLAGAVLVGAVPSFEDTGLFDLLDRHELIGDGGATPWHYHLVCVENLAAGKLAIPPPWDSEELSRAVGVAPRGHDRHTALGDARWARAIYDAVMGP
jgi:hypothetical protein